jgi:hypothetical protein
MRYSNIFVGIALSFYTLGAMAGIAYTQDVPLPKKEFLTLEEMVCVKPYNLKAKRVQGSKDVQAKAAFDSAVVQCETHDEFRGKPMHYQAGCSFSNGKWQCNEAQLEILVSANGRDVKMHPIGLTPESAYQILAKISTYGTYQGRTMDDAIGSSCYISPSKDKETVELNCQSIITVSFFCPQPQLTNCPRVVYVSPQLL